MQVYRLTSLKFQLIKIILKSILKSVEEFVILFLKTY